MEYFIVLSLDKFKIAISLEAACDYGKQCVSLPKSVGFGMNCSVPFSYNHRARVLFSAHLFNFERSWKMACMYMYLRDLPLSVQAQEDCTEMDIEFRQDSSLTTVSH